jgi:hypothetical protein
MRMIAILMIVMAAGCGGSGDDCQRFADKAGPMLAKATGTPFGDSERKQLVEACRKSGDKRKADPGFKCVLDAKGDAAVSACLADAFGGYLSRLKATEAKIQLNRIGKRAKIYWGESSAFPKGKAGPFPAEPCCKGPDAKCAVADWSKDPVWTALDFEIDEPTRFQYTYESDGQTVKATAIGDLDCDGDRITYTLDLTAANGNPEMKITEPTTKD